MPSFRFVLLPSVNISPRNHCFNCLEDQSAGCKTLEVHGRRLSKGRFPLPVRVTNDDHSKDAWDARDSRTPSNLSVYLRLATFLNISCQNRKTPIVNVREGKRERGKVRVKSLATQADVNKQDPLLSTTSSSFFSFPLPGGGEKTLPPTALDTRSSISTCQG